MSFFLTTFVAQNHLFYIASFVLVPFSSAKIVLLLEMSKFLMRKISKLLILQSVVCKIGV